MLAGASPSLAWVWGYIQVLVVEALIQGDEMTTDWLETEPAGTFTREQTLAVRRPAWVAASEVGGGAIYYFDWRDFFCRPRSGGRRLVPAREAPEAGWRHRRGCPCTLCRSVPRRRWPAMRHLIAHGRATAAMSTSAEHRQASPLAHFEPEPGQRRLSAKEVLATGRPALFDDFGECLLFVDGQLFDLRAAGLSLDGARLPEPLPERVLRAAVGIEWGWRHARGCDCCCGLAPADRQAPPERAADAA